MPYQQLKPKTLMKIMHVSLFIALLGIFSCTSPKQHQPIAKKTYHELIAKGAAISNQTQAVLLNHVGQAMQQGGSQYAVSFCNLKAFWLTDSLSQINNCTIERITDRPRNTANSLKNQTDSLIWQWTAENHKVGQQKDTLVYLANQLLYYKPIKLGLPTCLQCHGNTNEIAPQTAQKLKTLYPNDQATNYQLNELRGLWKIQFNIQKD